MVKLVPLLEGRSPGAHEAFVTGPPGQEANEDNEDEPLPGEGLDFTGAKAISFKGRVNPAVAATLCRIHQNLGHPTRREMARHLKIGGASPAMIAAAGQSTGLPHL